MWITWLHTNSFDMIDKLLIRQTRSRRKWLLDTSDSKSFSVHSSKSYRNLFHKFLSIKLWYSQLLIFFSTHVSQPSMSTKAEIISRICWFFKILITWRSALTAKHFRRRIVCGMIALAAKQCCKDRGLRDRNALTAKQHEFDRLRFKKRDRRIKFALELLTAKVGSLIEIETQKSRSSTKLVLELLIARLDW